ncbi:hypothetical protein [Paraburkholderia mimosarum]
MAFVMVLSYSRDIYLRFFLDARMENFLRGHIGAFNTWCGLPASHRRSYDRGAQIENPQHLKTLEQFKLWPSGLT